MKNLALITILLMLLAACGNSGNNNGSSSNDFEWEGTYEFKGQTITFNPDKTINATGDFQYKRYMEPEKNKCEMDIIGLVYMGIVEFHYKRKGNKIELYRMDMSNCEVKEKFGTLKKQ
jgi:hypothetical protein